VDILRTLLPSEGRYFSASYGTFHAQDQVGTLEEVVRLAMRNRDRGGEAYMALGGFDGTGRRTQACVVALRCLWLDVDCDKPGKPPQPFPDQPAALEALDAFVAAAGLPRPTIVSSGWGLHVYWPFDRDVAPARWRPLAEALKAAAARLGFPTDGHRTADSASVLRVPGTLNRREGQVRDVFLMETGEPSDPAVLEAALGADAPAPPMAGGPPVPAGPMAGMAAAMEGLVNDRDRDARLVIRGCPQMRAAGLPGAHRDHWALMLAAMRFCREGRRAAHLLSRLDPGRYAPATLDYQFGSLGRGGPPRCASFEALDPGPCAGCRHRGRIGTPVLLGDAPPGRRAAMPAGGPPGRRADVPGGTPGPDGAPPGRGTAAGPGPATPYEGRDFKVVPGKGLMHLVRDRKTGEPEHWPDSGDEKWILINENEFYIDEVQSDRSEVQERRMVRFLAVSPLGRARTVFLDLDQLGREAIARWLAHHGLLPVSALYNHAMWLFMSTYISKVQSGATTQRVDHFGWLEHSDQASGRRSRGFALGETLLTPSGPRHVALASSRCARMAREEFVRSGDLEAWRRIPRMYRELGQPEGQLFMCASFAAPLMAGAPGTAKNLVMSIWDSRGGKGKSTLLEAVNTVWGHPSRLTCSKNDTLVARYQILGVRRNLPMCMDELTSMGDRELSAFLFDAANGREKRKSREGGTELARTGHWETITMVTSNRSLYEVMRAMSGQTLAETMRVVEMPCRFRSHAGTPAGARVAETIALMGLHHGLAGQAFLEACLRDEGCLARAAAEADAFAQDVMRSSDERFWGYGLGTVLAAGRLAAGLGLLDYDLEALEGWVRHSLLPDMRRQCKETAVTAGDILAGFLREHLDNMLVVRAADRPEGMPPASVGADRDPFVVVAPRGRFHVRIERDTRRILVNRRYLDGWLAQRRLSPETLVSELAEAGVAGPGGGTRQAFLGRGTLLSYGASACYEFDGARLGIAVPGGGGDG
jgi:hypothetical protein